jgi:hypothetical protein
VTNPAISATTATALRITSQRGNFFSIFFPAEPV